VFYDVRDGWEPLCKVLDVPVPKCIEFPRINDGAAMDAFAQKQIQKGLIRWAIACSAALVAVGGSWRIFFK
jgi:hypothetical protein